MVFLKGKVIVVGVFTLALALLFLVGRTQDPYDKGVIKVTSVLFGTLVDETQYGDSFFLMPCKGNMVNSGQVLALVNTGLGKAVAARSPVRGEVTYAAAKSGSRIRTGDTLFLIRPILSE